MDPDDIYLNENLFRELYDYNLKYNLDKHYPFFLNSYKIQKYLLVTS